MSRPTIFISYSHKDEDWKDRLVTHLSVLLHEDIFGLWEDRLIQAGEEWKLEIETAISNASVAILMISASFLTSKFILSEEVPKLLERREKSGMRIIPLIVKPCAWTRIKWLSRLQARPKDGKPLSLENENQIDFHLVALTEEIADLVEQKEKTAPVKKSKDFQPIVSNVRQKIFRLIDFGEYVKAVNECDFALNENPNDALINILLVIAALKGKGADRYQTKTIKKLEKYLSTACDDPQYYPTALVIWGLIKYDHYKLNGLFQGEPTLDDIKRVLAKVNFELVDLELIEKIKASRGAYKDLDLLRYYPEVNPGG